MFAVDSSTLIAFSCGETGEDIDFFAAQLLHNRICLPPPVITEITSNPSRQPRIHSLMWELEALELTQGFWHRAGMFRSQILPKKLKCRTADTLIAQSCIDHDVPLITRDGDFKPFATYGGLKLAA